MTKKIIKFALSQDVIFELHKLASEQSVSLSETVERMIAEKAKKEQVYGE